MDGSAFTKQATSVLILVAYIVAIWYVTLPEWKRQALLMRMEAILRQGQERPRGMLLSAIQEMEIRQFRNLISRWDHEQVGSRDSREKGNQP